MNLKEKKNKSIGIIPANFALSLNSQLIIL